MADNLYRAVYQRYLNHSQSRFAEPEEIIDASVPIRRDGMWTGGIPVYCADDVIYVDDSDNHSIIVGQTGCKKTRTSCLPMVASVIRAGQTAIINDPKGEIYARTEKLAESVGAKVFVLNFRDPKTSHYWNPFAQAHEYFAEGSENLAIQCVSDFAESVCAQAQERTVDVYWTECAKAMIKSLALVLLASVPAECLNITNLMQMCYEDNCSTLRVLLKDMDPKCVAAFGLHSVVDLEAEKTRSCVYSTILSVLTAFAQDEDLQNMLCDSSFNLSELGESQHVIYVIYPDEKDTLSFLVNAFLTQCYEVLVTTADRHADKRLPVTVNFIIDEFSNLPAISSFENRISEARSRNIRYTLFIQSFEQLRYKYGDRAETILSNCSNWLCFSSKEIEFIEKVSAVCGREYDYNGVEHPLISPYDMQHLRKEREYAEVLMIRHGLHPYVAQMPDIDYTGLLDGIPQAEHVDRSRESKARFISFAEWYSGLYVEFKFPFPKDKDGKPKRKYP